VTGRKHKRTVGAHNPQDRVERPFLCPSEIDICHSVETFYTLWKNAARFGMRFAWPRAVIVRAERYETEKKGKPEDPKGICNCIYAASHLGGWESYEKQNERRLACPQRFA
jgi:hypothetical protein